MTIAFDLISDLHLETWPEKFDWTNQATSPICVVAGDLARDHKTVQETLKHLAGCYAAVFYIDGNDEHRHRLNNLGNSYRSLAKAVGRIDRVTYLQDNVVVVDGVAILGTNGWWGFDLDETIGKEESMAWMKNHYEQHIPDVTVDPEVIHDCARTDTAYLINSIQRLQTHKDVKKIVIVTHTVPDAELISHDISLAGTPQFNTMGNRLMRLVHSNDTEHKIDTWCFGHYHGSVDRVINDIRYVNNCRGRADTAYHQHVYYPKRIVIKT